MGRDRYLIDHPWDAWRGVGTNELSSGAEVHADCGPRVVAELRETVRFDVQRREYLPRVSFPFAQAGRELGAYRLPMDSHVGTSRHDVAGRLRIADEECVLTIVGAPGRPGAVSGDQIGERLSAHCEWQIHAFEELCESAEQRLPGVARCGWEEAWKTWHDPGKADARMALIVELAQEIDLGRSIRSVGRAPRRVLQRVRLPMPISRIQQLDSHCIRDFVRRPGVTVAQKAGPRQRLLGVRRRETSWTLENRVASWTLERIRRRAADYFRQNAEFASTVGSRVNTVARFGRDARTLRALGELNEADPAGLHHPVARNHPLQMDARYRSIYRAYLRLVREKRVLDESWGWQQALWSDTVRQITYSHLAKSLVAVYRSPLYVRREPDRGTWSLAPLAPGPFETNGGDLHVLDPVDIYADTESWFRSGLPFAEKLGATGCDYALWWPERRQLVACWAVVVLGSSQRWRELLRGSADSLSRLQAAVRAATGERCDVRGMVLAATTDVLEHTSAGPEQERVDDASVVGMRFGVGGPRGVHLGDFEAALELAADPLLRR